MHKETLFLLDHLKTAAAVCPRWQVMFYFCFLSEMAFAGMGILQKITRILNIIRGRAMKTAIF